jgi:hypothetical protein
MEFVGMIKKFLFIFTVSALFLNGCSGKKGESQVAKGKIFGKVRITNSNSVLSRPVTLILKRWESERISYSDTIQTTDEYKFDIKQAGRYIIDPQLDDFYVSTSPYILELREDSLEACLLIEVDTVITGPEGK